MSSKRGLGLYLRIAISLLLLIYLFGKVGWEAVWREISAADPWLLALYVALGLASIVISAVKWLVLARAQGFETSLWRLFLLYMVGYFFNHILPTSVGGDVVRAYELGRTNGRHNEAVASVFMERFTGFTTLMVFVVIALAFNSEFLADERLAIALAVASAGYILLTWLVFSRSTLDALSARIRAPIVGRLLQKARKLQDAIYLYRGRRRAMTLAMVYSIAFYLMTVAIMYVGCLSLGVRVQLEALFGAVPLILLLFTIPISIGGIGLQEWAYYFVLAKIGVPSAVGLGLGLIFRVRTLAFGLLGALVYPLLTAPSRSSAAVPTGGSAPPPTSG